MQTLYVPKADGPFAPNVGGAAMFDDIKDMQFPKPMWSATTRIGNILQGNRPDPQTIGPIVMQIVTANLTDESQMTISKGDAIFMYNPTKNVEDEVVVMNLQALNWYLEEAFLHRTDVNTAFASDEKVASKKRSLRSIDFYSFPVFLDEFKRDITFLGFMIGSDTPKGVRMRNITIAVDGLFRDFPNWFGSTDISNYVELRVMYYQNISIRRMRYDGSDAGEPVPGRYLQVRPHINRETCHPIIRQRDDSSTEEYSEDDACYMESTLLRLKIVDTDPAMRKPNGLLDVSHCKTDRISVLTVMPTEALVYSLGRVVDQFKAPSEEDARMAIRDTQSLTKIARDGCNIWLAISIKRALLTSAISTI